MDITISGPDPYEVTAQVNTLAEIYVAHNLENRLETSQKASAWLNKEVADLKEALQNAELALQNFLESKGFTPAELGSVDISTQPDQNANAT